MATATSKNRCVICGKDKASFKCEGCSQTFCYNHVIDHRLELNKHLDEIEVIRDLFRQTLIEETVEPQKHLLIQQINKWEQDSMKKIRQTAEETRQLIVQYVTENTTKIEVKLTKLTNQLRENRQENNFVETDLNQWKEELKRLEEELVKQSNISIQHQSTSLVNKICVQIPNMKWKQNGITIIGGKKRGNRLNQLSYPEGIYINDDDDQTIYIADFGNDRIIEWKCNQKNGQIVAGGNGQGNQNDQLNGPRDVVVNKENDSLIISDRGNRRVMQWPRQNGTSGEIIISNIDCLGLAMDNNGYLYVSECRKNEVRRWKIGDTNGKIVAGGNGLGLRLNQLNYPTFIFVDEQYSVYVSDYYNDRVMKWVKDAKEGIVVAGGKGQGNSLAQLYYPQGVIVDHSDQIYVADSWNNRVMRWCKGATEGTVVLGGNGKGEQPNQFNCPRGLLFDRRGNLLVVDEYNHRIEKFEIDLN